MKSRFMRSLGETLCIAVVSLASAFAQSGGGSQPGTDLVIYSTGQHSIYDGHFVVSAGRIYQVGRLNDPPGWDHIDNEAKTVSPVEGTVEIDVDEIRNTGSFVARLKVPEGDLVLQLDRFHEFNPCQNGGVAAFLFEHGDSGCGDTNWPKSFLYLAGWGFKKIASKLNNEKVKSPRPRGFKKARPSWSHNTIGPILANEI